jgi:hypothetical protein
MNFNTGYTILFAASCRYRKDTPSDVSLELLPWITWAGGPHPVRTGEGRYDLKRILPNDTTTFKVSSRDCRGDFFAMAHHRLKKGGPHRHLHHNEDEWWYVITPIHHIDRLQKERTLMHPITRLDGILCEEKRQKDPVIRQKYEPKHKRMNTLHKKDTGWG